jgi:hypothetical protein
VTTAIATLTVQFASAPPRITLQPVNQSVVAGGRVTFTAAASGTPTPTVQWQFSLGGKPFTNLIGLTFTPLTLFAVNLWPATQRLRAVFTNQFGTVTTQPAVLTVEFAPVISKQPASQKVSSGAEVKLVVVYSAIPTATVQWQQSTNGGKTFKNMSGATSTTLTIKAKRADNGRRYRAVVTNKFGSATSAEAILTIA